MTRLDSLTFSLLQTVPVIGAVDPSEIKANLKDATPTPPIILNLISNLGLQITTIISEATTITKDLTIKPDNLEVQISEMQKEGAIEISILIGTSPKLKTPNMPIDSNNFNLFHVV